MRGFLNDSSRARLSILPVAPRSLRLVQLAGCSLVLTGFTIDFAAIRWGGYIPTPLPGLFLADALWGAGAFLGLLILVAKVRPPTRHLLAGVLALVFGLSQLLRSSALQDSDPYLSLRDVAPFLYLGLVPLVAALFGSLRPGVFLVTLRMGAIVLALGYLLNLTHAEVFAPGGILYIESLEGIGFPGRGDILGVSLGVGLIAWGNFGAIARQSRILQVVLFAIGSTNGSRAGLLALAACTGWAIYRERRVLRWPKALGVLAVLTLCLFLGQVAPKVFEPNPAPNVLVPSPAPSALEPSPAPSVLGTGVVPTLTTTSVMERLLAEGFWNPTASARWDTYIDVARALTEDWTWVLGAGVGDPYTLLEACGVSPSDYKRSDGTEKCSVDSGSNLEPLRDPHNWVLAMLLYHGAVGSLIFISTVAVYLWPLRREPVTSLAVVPVLVYFMVGLFSVVVSSPFGMLPIATFLAVSVAGKDWPRFAGPPFSGFALQPQVPPKSII